jgi:hypothetical protein
VVVAHIQVVVHKQVEHILAMVVVTVAMLVLVIPLVVLVVIQEMVEMAHLVAQVALVLGAEVVVVEQSYTPALAVNMVVQVAV